LAEPREHRLLRNIEQQTRQKIEITAVPTVADLRARRLELTRASLRETILAGDLDHFRVVVDSLAQEFDIMDVAAAAVKQADAKDVGGEEEIPTVALRQERPPTRSGRDRGPAPKGPAQRAERPKRSRREPIPPAWNVPPIHV